MFYFPDSPEDALDMEKIKQSDFYLTLNDAFHVYDYDQAQYGQIDDLDFREVLLPALIYHPNRGAGYRDENGKLFIKDQNTGEYRPISSDYIQKNWGMFGTQVKSGGKPGDSFAHPQLFVKKHLPHLAEAGILKPEDFTTRTEARKINLDRTRREIKSKGRININGVFHNIGAKYQEAGNEFFQLEDNLGAVTDENQNIIATFNIFEQKDEISHPRKDGRKEYYVDQNQTCPTDFQLEKLFPQRKNENDGEYGKRLAQIASFRDVLQVDDELIFKHGIRPLDFSLKNQFLIATLAKKIGAERFKKFAGDYGKDGLRASVALENDLNMAEVIMKIGEQKSADAKFSARSIFRKYNDIIGALEKFEIYLKDNFSKKEEISPDKMQRLRENFTNKAAALLKKMSEEMKGKNTDEIISRLDEMKTEIVLLQSFLQYAKEQGEKIDLEDLRNIRISRKEVGKDLSEEEKREVVSMAEENYEKIFAQNKKAFDSVMNDLKNDLKNLSGQVAYSMKMEGKMLAFCKGKLLENGELYISSLNVRPEVQNYSLGILFLQKVIQELAKKYSIRAITREDNPANGSYKKLGFVFDENTFEKNGVRYFNILLPKKAL